MWKYCMGHAVTMRHGADMLTQYRVLRMGYPLRIAL